MNKRIAGLAGLVLALHTETANAGRPYTPLNPPAWQMNAYYRSVYFPQPRPIQVPPTTPFTGSTPLGYQGPTLPKQPRISYFQSTDSILDLAREGWPTVFIYVADDGTETTYVRTTWQKNSCIQSPPFRGPSSRIRVFSGWNYQPERRRQTHQDDEQ